MKKLMCRTVALAFCCLHQAHPRAVGVNRGEPAPGCPFVRLCGRTTWHGYGVDCIVSVHQCVGPCEFVGLRLDSNWRDLPGLEPGLVRHRRIRRRTPFCPLDGRRTCPTDMLGRWRGGVEMVVGHRIPGRHAIVLISGVQSVYLRDDMGIPRWDNGFAADPPFKVKYEIDRSTSWFLFIPIGSKVDSLPSRWRAASSPRIP